MNEYINKLSELLVPFDEKFIDFYKNSQYKIDFEKSSKLIFRLIRKAHKVQKANEYLCFSSSKYKIYFYPCERSSWMFNLNNGKSFSCKTYEFYKCFKENIKCGYKKFGIEAEFTLGNENHLIRERQLCFMKLVNSVSSYDGAGDHTWEFRSLPSNIWSEQMQQIINCLSILNDLKKEIQRSKLIKKLLNIQDKISFNILKPCGVHITLHGKIIDINGLTLLARYYNESLPSLRRRTNLREKCGYGYKSLYRDKTEEFNCCKHKTIEFRAFTSPVPNNVNEVNIFIKTLALVPKFAFGTRFSNMSVFNLSYEEIKQIIEKEVK